MTTLIIVIVFIAFGAVVLAYKLGQRRVPADVAPLDANSDTAPQVREIFHNVDLVDSEGIAVMHVEEISSIPFTSRHLDSCSEEVNRLSQLASDFIKAGGSIPGKTIRLVFKPEIAQGLKDGTYTLMRTKSGEVLADAVDATGQVAGKGRIVQGGSARQLAVGAFQLVSIAVAQAHLADIERSLQSIKSGITELLNRLEAADQSSISGAIAYLHEIAQHMKNSQVPIELSSEKSHVIENINQMGFTWRNKAQIDLVNLTDQVKNIKDSDTFGTGNTHKELRNFAQKIYPLIKRYDLLLQLAALTNMIVAYLDPVGKKYTRMRPEVDDWIKLVEDFECELKNKVDKFLKSATFTSDELLEYRKSDIHQLLSKYVAEAFRQKSDFFELIEKLEGNTRQLTHADGGVSLALRYDTDGVVRDAALVQ